MMEIFDQLSSVFSNSTRLYIIYLLDEDLRTITGLKTKIPDVSTSVISRHLSKLDEHGLITKSTATGRNYELSPFGKSILCLLKPLTFLLKYGYFRLHSLTSLPAVFLRSIDMLEHARFVEGTGSVMAEQNSFVRSVKRNLHYMTSTHFRGNNPGLDVKLRVIYPVKLFERIGVQKIQEDIKQHTNLSVDDVNIRLLPEIDIGIAIADDGEKGLVNFPRNSETTIDYAAMFIIDDETGMEYLKRIWEYYWNVAEPISLK